MLIDSLLAENIKKYRTDRALTQTELAQKIHVSCQAISKWERGLAMPELDKLCFLADEFQITLDELIGNLPNAPKMMIGVDGGGSKTDFILFDENGRIAQTLTLGPCNPNSVGIDGAVAVLTEGIDRLRGLAPRIQGVFIGSAGFKTGDNGIAEKNTLFEG
ncbi:MAG: XRE family transcriptional regulator [Clostridia bacterium]|nr:XRE family transcriptional regulator [Clostridia bacterium]